MKKRKVKAHKKLPPAEKYVRAKQRIPHVFANSMSNERWRILIALAKECGNSEFLVQAYSHGKLPKGDSARPSTVHRVPLPASEAKYIAERARFHARSRTYGTPWIQIVEGGAPGLVQQK